MKNRMKRLESKVAVVYGDGAVGSTIAKAFAREGARVFLTGRTMARLEAIANAISNVSSVIEISKLDALDEQSGTEHSNEVIKKAGKVDISFNAIGIPQKHVQDIPLTELSVESFSLPIITYAQSHFITTKAAAQRMVKQGNGVVLMHVPNASRISPPFVGGCFAPAWAAMEALCRSLSVEFGQA